jgi:allene oxide cyclase-like protein
MIGKRVGLGIAVATAIAAGGFAWAGSAGSAAPRGTIRLYEHDTSQAQIDLGDKGESPGDQFVFAGDVFDRKGGTKLGRLGGLCTTVSPSETLCTATVKLHGGQIASQILAASAKLFGGKTVAGSITGGSGIYRHARGYFTVRIPPDVPNLTDAYFVVHLR